MSLQASDLAGLAFTAGYKPEYLELLAKYGTKVDFSPGIYILQENEPADKFHIILQGRVDLGTFIPGRGFTTIQTIGDKEFVGWSWLIPPHRWRFSALVILPTQAIQFDGQQLREECETDHSFGYIMLQRMAAVLGRRLEETRKRLEV